MRSRRKVLIRATLTALAILAAAGLYKFYSTHFPRLDRVLDSATAGPSETWFTVAGGQVTVENGMPVFVEDTTDGEHYLQTRKLIKSDRTLVRVTATIETENLPDIWLRLISDDGSASVWFGLGQTQHIYRFGALDGSMHILADHSTWDRTGVAYVLHRRLDVELSARFKTVGKGNTFAIRLQGFRNGTTSYKGNGRAGWKVISSSIHIRDTGQSVSRLQPMPGGPVRLFANGP